MPDGFKQAAFDYDAYFSRTTAGKCPHILLTVAADNYSKIEILDIVSNLKEHIRFSTGQIFEVSNY
ncbi:MAG: hypothetical protein Q8936_23155 [Bacillota bacterium]|nr:hypothetical protein [Bacillota bacterium]